MSAHEEYDVEYRPIDELAKRAERFVRPRFDELPRGIGVWPPIDPGAENPGPAPLLYRKGEVLTTEPHVDVVRRLLDRLDEDCPPDADVKGGEAHRSERRDELPEGVVAVRVGADPLALARAMKVLARSETDVPDDLIVGPHFVLTFAPSPHVGPGSDPRPTERRFDENAHQERYEAACHEYSAKIAVIDSGMWERPPHRLRNVEIPDPTDREIVDGDGNGFVDFSHTGHGGFIAGVIERGAPGVGIVAKNAFHRGVLLEENITGKVAETAGDEGIVVLNMSLGSYQDDETHSGTGTVDMVALTAAMREWRARGLLVVAAAGNDHRDEPWYPAGFAAHPEFEDMVVSVGALEAVPGPGGVPLWRPADFSNYGPWVTAWAPGVDIESEYPYGLRFRYAGGRPRVFKHGRAYWDGTSFATPYVAAAILQHAGEKGVTPKEAWADLRCGGDAEDLRPFVVFGTHETHLVATTPMSHEKPATAAKRRRRPR